MGLFSSFLLDSSNFLSVRSIFVSRLSLKIGKSSLIFISFLPFSSFEGEFRDKNSDFTGFLSAYDGFGEKMSYSLFFSSLLIIFSKNDPYGCSDFYIFPKIGAILVLFLLFSSYFSYNFDF